MRCWSYPSCFTMPFVQEQILKLNKFEKVFGILLQMFGDDLNFRFDDVVTESYIRFTVVNYQLIQFKIFRFFFSFI